MPHRYRAAVIGCGRMGSGLPGLFPREERLSHCWAYHSIPQVDLVAACDLDVARVEAACKRWHVPRAYTSYAEMLRQEQIDLLSVCTDTASHYEVIDYALRSASPRAIFAEKPLSKDLLQVRKIIALARSRKVPIAVNYLRRWDPLHQRLRQRLQVGALGRIQAINGYYTKGIIHNGTHLLDLLLFFFGEVAWVWGNGGRSHGDEDDPSLDAYLFFDKQFGCSIHGCDGRHFNLFELDIVGEQGRVVLRDSGFTLERYAVKTSPRFRGFREAIKVGPAQRGDLYRACRHAVFNLMATLEHGRPLRCSAEESLRSLTLARRIVESSKRRRPLPCAR